MPTIVTHIEWPKLIQEAEKKAAQAEIDAAAAKAVVEHLRELAARFPDPSPNGLGPTLSVKNYRGRMTLSQGIKAALRDAGWDGLSPAGIRDWMEGRGQRGVKAKSVSAQLQKMKDKEVQRVGDGRWSLKALSPPTDQRKEDLIRR